MGKNEQYMHDQEVKGLHDQITNLNEYILLLETRLKAVEHDLAVSEGLWCTDKENGKATFQLFHASLHPEGLPSQEPSPSVEPGFTDSPLTT